jgi:hypothetical protein
MLLCNALGEAYILDVYRLKLIQKRFHSNVSLVNFYSSDAGCIQICSHTEASLESEACHDAAVYPQTTENADQVSRSTMAQKQHENYVCNIPKSQASAD